MTTTFEKVNRMMRKMGKNQQDVFANEKNPLELANIIRPLFPVSWAALVGDLK